MTMARDKREVVYKGHRDMVTQVDKASEAYIIKAIRQRYPDHAILAEEGGNSEAGTSSHRWIIDPLDGTTNFVHGFPVFAVSIAVERDGVLLAGAVYDPSQGELFSAGKGLGTTRNGQPVGVSQTAELGRSLLATGFPYTNNAPFDLNMELWRQIYGKTQGLRRAGAAALDLAWVASGRLDGYWEFGLEAWDMAAGVLLVQEAGGTVSGPFGEPLTMKLHNIIAANPHIYQLLRNELSPFKGRI